MAKKDPNSCKTFHYDDEKQDECQNNPLDCTQMKTRNPDGSLKLRNPNIDFMDEDILYHLALSTSTHNLPEMFGDVKFVCTGGTPERMETFAYYIMKEMKYRLPTGTCLKDLSQPAHRYSLYKIGPVLSVSHGMGIPSMSILLHELIKLVYYAKIKDPIFFRIGTCGGIGLKPGTLVISNGTIDEMGNPYYTVPILGVPIKRPTKFDQRLINELKDLASPSDDFDTVIGTTMCANDFYEGQGRIDGAFCDYTERDKLKYLKELHEKGVKNIEMESAPFGALTYYAGIKAAVVCVTLLDRLQGDQITSPKSVLAEYQDRPQKLVARYIKQYLEAKGSSSKKVP